MPRERDTLAGGETGGLPAFKDTLLPSQDADVLEGDELWSFAPKKAQTLWLRVALCRRPRQIVAWSLGDRSARGAADLRATSPVDHRRCHTRSDFWEADAAVFPKAAHRCCAKREGGTCRVERWFGTLRARVSRLVRKAYSFSKHPESHLDAIHFFIVTYNLPIKQSTPE